MTTYGLVMGSKVDEFIENLTLEVFRAQDFFDWPRIENRLRELEPTISILQSLDRGKLGAELTMFLQKEPSLLRLIHLLTAHQPSMLRLVEGVVIDFDKEFRQPITEQRASEIVDVLDRMGVIRLLVDARSIRDLVAGVLTGLEHESIVE